MSPRTNAKTPKKGRKGCKMISETFFSELARKSPFLIFENRLYQIAEGEGGEGFIKAGTHTFGLHPAPSLAELEQFYRGKHTEEIFTFKKAFVEEKVKQEMKTYGEMSAFVGENRILPFILTEVFPQFLEQDSETEELFEDKSGKEQSKEKMKEIMEKVVGLDDIVKKTMSQSEVNKALGEVKEQLIGELERSGFEEEIKPLPAKPSRRSSEDDSEIDSLLSEHYKKADVAQILRPNDFKKNKVSREDTGLTKALGNQDVLVMKGIVHKLSPVKKAGGFYLHIGGKDYTLSPAFAADRVESAYLRHLQTQFKIEAVDEFEDQAKQLQEIKVKNAALEKFFKKDEFDVGEVGFVKKNGTYYVYLQVPEFVLKDVKKYDDYYVSGKLYHFKPCKVAVSVVPSGTGYQVGNPVVIDTYVHPFLKGDDAWQGICMGNYNWSRLESLDPAAKIATVLSAARNVLLKGYTSTCGPHHPLERNYFHAVSESEVQKKGWKITNVDSC
jgi:hypothetical protein